VLQLEKAHKQQEGPAQPNKGTWKKKKKKETWVLFPAN